MFPKPSLPKASVESHTGADGEELSSSDPTVVAMSLPEPPQAGPVDIYSLADVLENDYISAEISRPFAGPLELTTGPSQAEVVHYAETQASIYQHDPQYKVLMVEMNEYRVILVQSVAILWRMLAIAVSHNGRTTALASAALNQFDNTVCFSSY
jgi:hypothetical protein